MRPRDFIVDNRPGFVLGRSAGFGPFPQTRNGLKPALRRQRILNRAIVSGSGLLVLVLMCHGWAGPAQAQDFDEDAVTIVLIPQATVDDTLVSLQQIARVAGGPVSLRKRLEKLDVADFRLEARHQVITSEQVRFRLLLAGIPEKSFRLEGARRSVVVESDETMGLRKVLGCASEALRQRNGDGILTPRRGIYVPALDVGPTDRLHLEARVKSAPPAGTARVDVSLQVNGKTREVVQVMFDIAEREVAPKKVAHVGQAQPSAPVNPSRRARC